MIVTTETVSGVARRLNVTVPTSRIDEQFEARLKRAAKNVKINGFRPGKVPMSRIRADYGPGIRQEVINDLIRDSVFEAIQQQNINAVGLPNIEKVDLNDQGLVYEATVEVYPEIDIKGLDDLSIERKTSDVTDADLDTMIDNLRKQRQTWTTTKAMAKKDMQATFDFEGSIDGEAFEGGNAQDFKLVLGSGRMIPGFEDGIIGMKAGEEKTIDVTFPEDYQAENLRGKAAQFKIKLKQVEKPKLPEVDAEFLNVFGVTEEEGIDKLKADVRKNMEREVKNSLRQQLKQTAFNAVLENNTDIEVPASMVTQEIGRQRDQMLQQFAQQFGGKTPNFDQSMLPDELFREQAERSVKLGVLIGKIVQDASLVVDQERVKTFIEEAAQSYEEPSDVIEYFSNDKEQRAQIEGVVLEDQVVDYILSKAKISDNNVSYKELIEQQQAQRANR